MTDQIEEQDLDDLLAAAVPGTSEVPILLDGSRREEWNHLVHETMQPTPAEGDADGRMAAPSRAKRAQKRLDELRAELRSKVLTIHVTQLPGSQWAALKAKHKPRKNNLRDEGLGYNIEAVAFEALVTHGKRVRGDVLENVSVKQWEKIRETVGGGDLQALEMTVLALNQIVGQQMVGQLVKGSPTTSNSVGN